MMKFEEYLSDPVNLSVGLASLKLKPREMDDLETLYKSLGGISVTRDKNNVIRGETISSSSSIGRKLTTHFHGVRPRDLMMWIGELVIAPDQSERWVLSKEIRAAIEKLQWFGGVPARGFAIATAEGKPDVSSQNFMPSADSSIARAGRLLRLQSAPKKPQKVLVTTTAYLRNPDVVEEVLYRAGGVCEYCRVAPFRRRLDGTPYLEVHHRIQLAHDGEDTVENAVALCPNCHRREHYGEKLL